MKRILFLMSHLGCEWETMMDKLKRHPRIDGECRADYSVHHPDDLMAIKQQPHKRNDSASIWLVPILHNHQFTYKRLCKYDNMCKFVFYWKHPFVAVERLVKEHGYGREQAQSYWDDRFNGLYEYRQRTTAAIWLEWKSSLRTQRTAMEQGLGLDLSMCHLDEPAESV